MVCRTIQPTLWECVWPYSVSAPHGPRNFDAYDRRKSSTYHPSPIIWPSARVFVTHTHFPPLYNRLLLETDLVLKICFKTMHSLVLASAHNFTWPSHYYSSLSLVCQCRSHDYVTFNQRANCALETKKHRLISCACTHYRHCVNRIYYVIERCPRSSCVQVP